LFEQNLSRDEIFNVWCDRAAKEAWEFTNPIFNQDVTPGEKWALFLVHPTRHKIIGNFSENIFESLGFEQLLNEAMTE
jgi:hypothetical protein